VLQVAEIRTSAGKLIGERIQFGVTVLTVLVDSDELVVRATQT
jgi:hypothetical protein